MIYDIWDLSTTSYLYENLNEGLIKSYSISDIQQHLQNFIKDDCIKSITNMRNPYYSNKKYCKNEFVRIDLKVDSLKHTLQYNKVIETCYNLFGWFIGIIEIKLKVKNGYIPIPFYRGEPYRFKDMHDYKNYFYSDSVDDDLRTYILKNQNNIYSISLIAEQKFPIQEYIYDISEIFYHITDFKNIDKIKKVGLIPKSKYNYPSRIYLSNDKDDLLNDFELNISDKVLLTIKFDNYKKIFYDPRSNGFFTYENIAPNEIIKYEKKNI